MKRVCRSKWLLWLTVVSILIGSGGFMRPRTAEASCPIMVMLPAWMSGPPRSICNVRQVTVRVNGGDRNLFEARAIAEAVGAVVDWQRTESGDYVTIATRHSHALFKIGSGTYDVWRADGTEDLDLVMPSEVPAQYYTFMVEDPARPGHTTTDVKTMLPIRAVADALGADVLAWEGGVIKLQYAGSVLMPYEVRQAARFVDPRRADPGEVYDALNAGLVSVEDVQLMADWQGAVDAIGHEWADIEAAHAMPITYVQLQLLQARVITHERVPSPDTAAVMSNQMYTVLGVRFTTAELRQMGQEGEAISQIVAQKLNWQEVGLTESGERLDVRAYNREKLTNTNSNGPDSIWFVTNERGLIQQVVFVEAKFSTRGIWPSTFAKNRELVDQIGRLMSNTRAQAVARYAQWRMERLRQRAELGEIDYDTYRRELDDQIVSFNLGIATTGFFSKAFQRLGERARGLYYGLNLKTGALKHLGGNGAPVRASARPSFPSDDNEPNGG